MPTKKPSRVEDYVVTYRLRIDDLRDHLEALFKREVPVKISPDNNTYYVFKIPRKLSDEEKDYIYEHVRYHVDDQFAF